MKHKFAEAVKNEEIQDLVSNKLARAAAELHQSVNKGSFKFNLHHVVRVIAGLEIVKEDQLMKQQNPVDFVAKLWAHETNRSYTDCLETGEDLNQFKVLSSGVKSQHFPSINLEQNLLFANFLGAQD